MGSLDAIEAYLRSQLHRAGPRPSDGEPVTRSFVTISRQAGTGGLGLAEAIVAEFDRRGDPVLADWGIFDRTICEMVAADPGFAANLDLLLEEVYRPKWADLLHQAVHGTIDQDLALRRAFLVVQTLAGMGKAVMVGRAGAQATEGMAGRLAIRMVAPLEYRAERMMGILEISERQAIEGLERRDRDRERLVRSLFDVDIDDATHYDMVLNAAHLTHAQMAVLIAEAVRGRVGSDGE